MFFQKIAIFAAMKLIFKDDNGGTQVFDSYAEATRETGLGYRKIRKDARFSLSQGIFVVRDRDRYRVCQKNKYGGFVEMISGEPVGGTRAVDITGPMFSGQVVTRMKGGRCAELGGGYRVYESGKVTGPGSPDGLAVQKDGCVVMSGRRVRVADLVAEKFLPRVMGMNFVGHRDGNKLNNAAQNLEWRFHEEGRKVIGVSRTDAHGRGRKVFRSVREAAEDRGVSPSMIYQFISGRKRDCQGYIWSFNI